MDTLLIQLVAPMQSWGIQSLHGDRDSGLEPSKSGVIGLICAAMGMDRTADLSKVAALRMGVRVDREGTLKKDFQKAEPLDATGNIVGKVTIGYRHYLSDAAFLVGLEGDTQVLAAVPTALQQPVYSLFLGRKAFPPAAPIWLLDGLKPGDDLESALQNYPPIVSGAPVRRRMVIEDLLGPILLNDQPVSFSERRFAPRRIKMVYFEFPMEV
ncbi:MAG: type I-E CRISPR-associated protein Cas5/CasD [Chloroflexi bacterium GWB2_54_36]|nr:MAG: type I-E CRISPR-associated protein Cas5/CasD [Chloroflexi bacterium GWB2_54_36]